MERRINMISNLNMNNKRPVKGKKQKMKKLSIFFLILVLLSVVSTGLSVVGYETYTADYHRDLSLAQVGMQHLRMAETLTQKISETCVFLNREDMRTFFKRQFCQRAQPGTNLDHIIVRS